MEKKPKTINKKERRPTPLSVIKRQLQGFMDEHNLDGIDFGDHVLKRKKK